MIVSIRIALAGNPNSGKTTLFNGLTGSNQYVGNWPGVTVEKKEGKFKKNDDVIITDLPGIYSLSPYTLEEVVARNYLIGERPNAILNIVDGTNLERNLYLTTQLTELGIPTVVAINMMDIVEKNGDKIDIKELSKKLGCPIVEISALKGTNTIEAAETAVKAARGGTQIPKHEFSPSVEDALKEIGAFVSGSIDPSQRRWYAVKLFERDDKVMERLSMSQDSKDKLERIIARVEEELDDDSESIITNERYEAIGRIIKNSYSKKDIGLLSKSDKIDQIVTNRWLALPIFAVIMFIVYYVSVTTVGTWATDWVNDGVFGDGWHLFGIGSKQYEQAAEEYEIPGLIKSAFIEACEEAGAVEENEGAEEGEVVIDEALASDITAVAYVRDDDGNIEEEINVDFAAYKDVEAVEEPDPAEYGIYVPSIPGLIEGVLDKVGCAEWLRGLILDGIVAGVGAVLGFVPQILVLFIFLAFLESCGYMARIAFVMDRIFRRFGLSGKSFIPMLVGTGCGVPGIMASRTIENERDRRMTIITTTFMPCGAKLPIIALFAGALFPGSKWVAPSAYFLGITSIIVSGIILKKTKIFAGDPAPFVMELPQYHMPTVGNVLRSMWERGWSFIKKAGTVILLSTVVIWFLSSFGMSDGGFGMVDQDQSLLAGIGQAIAFIFVPLGFGFWQAAVGTVTGLAAKENVVSTMGVLFGGYDEIEGNGWQIYDAMRMHFTQLSAYSYLAFNLLCAPCFAAIGAVKREMNNPKWTWFAIGYQCVFAYAVALMIYQFGRAMSTLSVCLLRPRLRCTLSICCSVLTKNRISL